MFKEKGKINIAVLLPKVNGSLFVYVCISVLIVVFFAACSELEKPKPEEYYSETKPPRKQEFRWSNGKMPKSFDPALAAAAPETDIVRAIYDGLTETDPKTLKAIPAIAQEWKSSEDHKTWTFKLRRNVKWSNGEEVTASYFVDSWRRLVAIGEKVPHRDLLNNIVGVSDEFAVPEKEEVDSDTEPKRESDVNKAAQESRQDRPTASNTESFRKLPNGEATSGKIKNGGEISKISQNRKRIDEADIKIGVKAINEYELEISLKHPDHEFPNLVAHPIFRPIYDSETEPQSNVLNKDIVTSGAFRVVSIADDGIVLERAEHYWNRKKVKLERVRFVPAKDADSALKAYREGKVDAVTNVEFEPLALKLLTPYYDFHRTTHGALNFYEFNRQKAPFNDRRVRLALAISINRERLTEDEMDGATKPAFNFSPYAAENKTPKFAQDVKKAKAFFETAGFEDGKDFPKIRLVINRNNVQQRIARSVAKMWKQHLNVDTEIVTKEIEELEAAKRNGDYDLLRRGVVLPTPDETANMLAIFKPVKGSSKRQRNTASGKPAGVEGSIPKRESADLSPDDPAKKIDSTEQSADEKHGVEDPEASSELIIEFGVDILILTEEDAILEVPAIPLYFPTSYSLIKPYVMGFEMNTLNAPSLKEVQINNNWQPNISQPES